MDAQDPVGARSSSSPRRKCADALHAYGLRLQAKKPMSLSHRALFRAWKIGRPVRARIAARRIVRQFGPEVERISGVAVDKQESEIARLIVDHGFLPEEYYRYRLFERDRIDEATMFLSFHVNMVIRNEAYRLGGIDESKLADKRTFYRACSRLGLASAATIAEFCDGAVQWWPGHASELPPRDLFVKRADRLCGEGAERWIYDGGRYRGEDGATHTADELIDRLCQASLEGAFLVQPRLANHPAIADLSTGGLCTARVITARSPGREPEHVMTIFRMPTGNLPADNFAAGGLAARVDASTGRLGEAIRKDIMDAITKRSLTHHPDTGGNVVGRVLPRWAEVVQLSVRAHQSFPEFPSVGWDVAITPDGPVLLEGNFNWDVILAQQPGPEPLWETPVVDLLLMMLDKTGPTDPRAPEIEVLRRDAPRPNPRDQLAAGVDETRR